MAVLNTQARTGGSDKEFVLLPTDVYRMKITKAVVEENRFADVNRDGTKPLQLVLTWEITTLSDEQRETAQEMEEEWDKAAVWQRLNPYYGTVREGGSSKFKAFIDALREQGHLPDFNPELFDPDSLLGIEQRISVEKYIKSQGDNAGKPGNKVVSVLPIKRAKNGKTPAVPATPRNEPVAVSDDAELPF